MEIPHKSRQKKGWLYWSFYQGEELSHPCSRYVNAIRIFVKGNPVAIVCELVYRDRWKYVHDFDSIAIMENDDEIPLSSIILADIKKNLFLIGHFPFFGFEKEMVVKIPPPDIIQIPVFQNTSHSAFLSQPFQLEYRLKNTDVNNAYYKLTSKVSIQVE